MRRGRPAKCPYCGSTSTVSKGVRKTATMGARPLRKCKGCGRRFTLKAPVKKKST
jgi:transcription elongation factor Elf1